MLAAVESNPHLEIDVYVAKNSRLGFRHVFQGMHQAIDEAKPNNPSGIGAALRPECVRSRSTGKERDAETKLDFFGARYFSAAQGRFTSADPLEIATLKGDEIDELSRDPQNWNKYAYVGNNPLTYLDPTGQQRMVAPGLLAGWAKEVRALRQEYAQATGLSKVWVGIKLAFKEFEMSPTPFAMASGGALAKSGQGLEASAQVLTSLGRNSTHVLEGLAEGVAYRVPDLMGNSAQFGKLLGEVKNVQQLALTSQIRDAFKAAKGAGSTLHLFVAEKTRFTRPLLNQIRTSGARVFRHMNDEWVDVTEELLRQE